MKKLILVSSLLIGSCFALENTQKTPMKLNSQENKLSTISNNSSVNLTIKTPITRKSNIETINQGPMKPCNISETPGLLNNCIITIEANGIGVAPASSISPAQAMAMARRAAIIDGYKALTEKLYGIKVNGRETVKDMVLQNSVLRSKIAGIIRGAVIEEEDYKNGMYKVVMSLKLNVKNWNKYLKENPPYSY